MLHLDRFIIGDILWSLKLAGYTHIRSVDTSCFDASVSRPASDFEHHVLSSLGADDPSLFIHSSQPSVSILTRLKIRLKKTFGRNSGDSNTSWGNTLNGAHEAHIFHEVVRTWPGQIIILVFSDDTLILSKAPISSILTVDAHAKLEADYGFLVRMRDSDDIRKCAFLSARPVEAIVDGLHTYLMTPLPGKCLPKLFYTNATEAFACPDAFRNAVIRGAISAFSGDPLTCSFLAAHLRDVTAPESFNRLSLLRHLPYFFRSIQCAEHKIEPVDIHTDNVARYGKLLADALAAALEPPATPLVAFTIPLGVSEFDDF